ENAGLQASLEDKEAKLAKLKNKHDAKNKQLRQLGRKLAATEAAAEKKLVLAEIKFNNSQNNASQLGKKLDDKNKKLKKVEEENTILVNQLAEVKNQLAKSKEVADEQEIDLY